MSGQVPFTFDDGKEPGAFRTIGEVAQAFGLRQHVLRYWEEQFPALKPLKRAGGRRYYRPEDVATVAEISRLLHQEGFTIRGARQALGGKPGKAPEEAPEPERLGEELERTVSPHAPDAPNPIASSLRALRDRLASALHEG